MIKRPWCVDTRIEILLTRNVQLTEASIFARHKLRYGHEWLLTVDIA